MQRNLEYTLDGLARFPDQLAQLFHCFPPERRNWKPPSWDGIPSEKLSGIEQVCHVLDIEVEGYRIRFERTRTQSSPVLPDLPGEQMAMERNYALCDAVAVLKNFAIARADTLQAIRNFSPDELERVAIFEGRQTTLAGLVHFLSSHDYQHLSGLQWLLAKMDSER
jgi:hypothetical protein